MFEEADCASGVVVVLEVVPAVPEVAMTITHIVVVVVFVVGLKQELTSEAKSLLII